MTLFRPRRTPVILQTEAAECGLACLAMVAGRHGHRVDLPAMRRRYDLSLNGMTLVDIIRVANGMHMATRALRVELSHLHRVRLPAILHWDHNHFVVLVRLKRTRAIVHDPALGRREVPVAELSRRFTGIVLEAWPGQEFERKTERERIRITELLRRTEGIGRAALQVLLMSLVLEIITIAMPAGFQLVLDDVVVSADRNLLTVIVLGLGLLLAFQTLTDFVRSWAIMGAGTDLMLQWKTSLYSHLMRLPLGYFERRQVGDIVSRFGSIDSIQKTMATGSVSAVMDGAMAVALVVVMWLYNGWLCLLAVLFTALYAGLRGIAYRVYRTANQEAIINAAQETSHMIETLRGMASIKAMILGDRRQAIWNNYLVDRVNAELRVRKLDVVFHAATTLLFGLDRVLIVYFGARAVLSGSLSVGMLVAFLAYKDQFSTRVSKFLDTIVEMRMLSVHGERIAEIALAEPEESRSARRIMLPAEPVAAAIERGPILSARGIHFRYGQNDPEIIAGLDLDIAAGECVAIVGPSGAGKSTLLKILAGLLRPSAGQVCLDGAPVSAIGLSAYRSVIGCVLQDDRLFAGSIADNITGFTAQPDTLLLQKVAQLASIHEEILRMPMGYETLVGDMGSALSGGQMQRVVLARALYRQPRILLLDEATSHLDEENERAINEAVRALPMARVIVAHRRSTIDMADRFVPLWPANASAATRVIGFPAAGQKPEPAAATAGPARSLRLEA